MVVPVLLLAQPHNPEAGRIQVAGSQATMFIDAPRPLDSVTQTLAEYYGLLVNVEDPEYIYSEDVKDVTAEVARSPLPPGRRVLVPKGGKLEVPFAVDTGGAPRDLRALLQAAVDQANARFPFWYRVDDGAGFTLIPTKTRDAQGQVVDRPSLLDSKITLAASTRHIYELGQALADALSAQTGYHVSCCQSHVGGVPWGIQVVAFEAHDESARSVLVRLMSAAGGRTHYFQRCDPVQAGLQTGCAINVSAAPAFPPR